MSACGECEAVVTTRTRCRCDKFRECCQLRHGRMLALKVNIIYKGNILRAMHDQTFYIGIWCFA